MLAAHPVHHATSFKSGKPDSRRRRMLASIQDRGPPILESGTGSGRASILIGAPYPAAPPPTVTD
jgi:hypothetical protein